MMTFDLTPEELALVGEILHAEYQELRQEIVHTDNSHFKDGLRAREQRLAALITKFDLPGGVAAER